MPTRVHTGLLPAGERERVFMHLFLSTYTSSSYVHTYPRPHACTQVCFRPANASAFARTGVGVVVQQDLLHVRVNGLLANGGALVALPRAPGSTVGWSRVLPDVGYHEKLQGDGPVALYSFEDVDVTTTRDTHCVPCADCTAACEHGAGEVFFDGRVGGATRGIATKAAAGSGKYLVLDGLGSWASVEHSVLLAGKAMTLAWLMKPSPCATADSACRQTVPYI